MKLRKKSKAGDESYWKSFTDIMAGLLLVILLVLMLLLLYMTQMNKDTHKYDNEFEYSRPADDNLHDISDHLADELYDRPPQDAGGGGGGGGGEDDPGTSDTDGINYDTGHDKCAVHVTVIDEETKKTIKKQGILFELYRGNRSSGTLLTLYTYYPVKTPYKKFETTDEGTFFLPEKIRLGWYQLHNLKAPKGYSFADDVNFELTDSLDWPEPYEVVVPMSPSKSVIYIQNVDADTKKPVAGGEFEIYAAADIVTLDGTVRHKEGDMVGTIKCDDTGKGASKKLYLGEYNVVQKKTPKYYAVNTEALSVKLDYLDTDNKKTYTITSRKTQLVLTLIDQQTKAPIEGAVYAVTAKGEMTTDKDGVITVTDLDKNKSYNVVLKSLPEPYRITEKKSAFQVDAAGLIDGQEVSQQTQTAYIIRLTVSAKDMLFGNEISSSQIRLYNENGTVVEEWTATGEQEEFEDLDPGVYTLEVGGDKANRERINLKDQGGIQTLEVKVWTLWDTLSIVGAAVAGVLLLVLVISLIRSRRKRKANEEE